MKKSITIVVPAYNEEGNIEGLLKALSRQRVENFALREIVVLSDGSTDSTESIVRREHELNKKIKLQSGTRIGKSRKISNFLKTCTSDMVVLLDADIQFKDINLLNKIVRTFEEGSELGLVALCDFPTRPRGFVQSTIAESICVWNEVKEKNADGQSIHNIHGRAYAMTKGLYSSVNIPKEVFNDDEYVYLLSRKLGLGFVHLCKTKVYYEAPKNISDFIRQSSRFSAARESTINFFGKEVLEYFQVSPSLKYKIMLKHLTLHPLFFILTIIIQLISKIKGIGYKENFERGYWTVIQSTKVTEL